MTAGAVVLTVLVGAVVAAVAGLVGWLARGWSRDNRDRERAADALETAQDDVRDAERDEGERQGRLGDDEVAKDFDRRFGS